MLQREHYKPISVFPSNALRVYAMAGARPNIGALIYKWLVVTFGERYLIGTVPLKVLWICWASMLVMV